MAVWPFWRPWPRTAVTVMPEMFTLPRASLMSSTLLGRTMALMSFIALLQHTFQIPLERHLGGLRQLGRRLGKMEDVDGLVAFRRDQHEIHVAAVRGDHPADPVEEPQPVLRDDSEHVIALRVLAVEINDRRDAPWAQDAPQAVLPAPQQVADLLAPGHHVLQLLLELRDRLRVEPEEVLLVGELEDVQDQPARARHRAAPEDIHAEVRQDAADIREQVRLLQPPPPTTPQGGARAAPT